MISNGVAVVGFGFGVPKPPGPLPPPPGPEACNKGLNKYVCTHTKGCHWCVDKSGFGFCSVGILIKLLSNVAKEPHNLKFRKIRMTNAKIAEEEDKRVRAQVATCEVMGHVSVLQLVFLHVNPKEGKKKVIATRSGTGVQCSTRRSG